MQLCAVQGEPVGVEDPAGRAPQNRFPGLGAQPFPRTGPEQREGEPGALRGPSDSAGAKKEYDNPYFEPQYGFPPEDDAEHVEEQGESYIPNFNQIIAGNK